jgi:hypothetical protein
MGHLQAPNSARTVRAWVARAKQMTTGPRQGFWAKSGASPTLTGLVNRDA